MNGTNATTGKPLSGIDHLRQSITDILTTPVGTRVQNRAYGSGLFELLDAPLNQSTLLDIYAATVDALDAWEPRLQVQSVKAVSATEGGLLLDIAGLYLPDGKPVNLSGVVVH